MLHLDQQGMKYVLIVVLERNIKSVVDYNEQF